MGYKNVEDRRAYHRQYMKERRDWLKAHGFCSECKRQDAYTLNGHARCFDCTQQKRTTNRIKYGWTRVLAPDDPDYIPPDDTPKAKYPPKGERHCAGLCEICCKPLDGAKLSGISAASLHREESWLCQSCYAKTVKAAAKGRAVQKPWEPFSIGIPRTPEQAQSWDKYKAEHKARVAKWEEQVKAQALSSPKSE